MTLLRSKTDCYHVIEEIGRGTFGKVLKALKKESGQLVAIKVIKNDQMRSNVIKNEIKLLNAIRQLDLDQSHLVRFYEHFLVQDTFCLVFELLHKNLYEYQKEIRFAPIPLRHIRTITAQVLEALCKLKELSIIHSDLKPENIVLVDQVRYPFRVKVVDFGSASILSEVKHVKEPYIQSRFYRAPEILLGLPFCQKLDMWSLGCIIAELHHGYPLFPGNNEYDQIKYICETQGLPDNYLLNAASKALFFFKYTVDTQRRIQWRMKTEEEYQLATKVKPVEKRKYVLKSLDQIELLHKTKSYYPELELLAERYDLKNMVELMKRMLTWDSNKRINPYTALKHPFISLQHLRMHYRNSRYYQLSRQCRYEVTVPEQAFNDSRPPGNHLGLWSLNRYQGLINDVTDGEEVNNMTEQMNELHIEETAEEAHLKATDGAAYLQEPADLLHRCGLSGFTEPLHPDSRREIVAAQLDSYYTSKMSQDPPFLKSAVCLSNLVFIGKQIPDPAIAYGNVEISIAKTLHLSPRKSNVEARATAHIPETETEQRSAGPLMDRVCHSMDKWRTGIEKRGDLSNTPVRGTASHIMACVTDTCQQADQRT